MTGNTRKKYILSIDQGTTSSRAVLFDDSYTVVGLGQQAFRQHFPRSGRVEHEPMEIWQTTLDSCRTAMSQAGISASAIVAIGIANQRETTMVWDRKTGKPVYNAIVWQDRRTSDTCKKLRDEGHEAFVTQTTGLLLDPYFSATKIAWILDTVEGTRQAAEAGNLAFGTVDSFLLWHLTGGSVHATDATNASRTMLYDIHNGCWHDGLLDLFNVPASVLPVVHDCAHDYGTTNPDIFGSAIPVSAIVGDQQAAAVGQACFKPGMMKTTYGTGCFALLNTGDTVVHSGNRLLATIACQLNGKPVYALEGSIFMAGATVQWLRDGLGLIECAGQSGELARTSSDAEAVYMVPAFTGLGAPHWDAACRGAIFGLTRNTGPAEIAAAALEAVCFQTNDLLSAMQRDWGVKQETVLRVDGGMAASDWTMQRLADILDAPVDRSETLETTALGAAWLAGMHMGFYPAMDDFARTWKCQNRFTPALSHEQRATKLVGWQDAVQRTLSRPPDG